MDPNKYFHDKKFQCLKLNTLLSTKGKKCIWKKIINFVTFWKSIPTSTSTPKNFSVWRRIKLFQSKEQKVCWRSLSIFVTFQKMCSDKKRQVLPCQKVQCLKLNILFFNPRNEIYLEEDYQLLAPFKKCIPTSTCILKTSVFENQYLFSIKITKCMWRKTINICHLPKNVFRQKLPCQKNSVFEASYTFSNQWKWMYGKTKYDYQFSSPVKKCIPTKSFSVWNWIQFF